MGTMGRPRHPDILTPREWEVLALLRERRTNEQIASRLGITLDGAKYHVSQILSKLGVATREEAAAVVLGERRRWWAARPVWAKIAGAATVAAAVAGLAVVVWGVVETSDEAETSEAEVRELTSPAASGTRAPAQPATVLATSPTSSVEPGRFEGVTMSF